jgi:hypothetical protein
MLDNKSLAVLTYLKNHFTKSDKPIAAVDMRIDGLNLDDIFKSIDILEQNGDINVNTTYVALIVDSINN